MQIGDENSKPVSTSKWLEYLDKPTDNQHSLGIVAPDELQNLPTPKMASNILKRIVYTVFTWTCGLASSNDPHWCRRG